MKKFGIAAILSVVDKNFSRGMRKARKSTGAFRSALGVAGTALGGIMRGFSRVGGAALRFGSTIGVLAGGAGIGAVISSMVNFERRFGALKAVLGRKNQALFDQFATKAKELGASTAFTSSQAIDAMKALAQAGLAPAEVLQTVGTVLDVAAAGEIDLATAASIVSKNMKAFGIEAKDAQRITDALAFTARNANTDIIGLQEGLKLSATDARGLGFTVEQTTGLLGALADIGRDNTLAGTALRNTFVQIAKNIKNGRIQFGKFTVTTRKSNGELKTGAEVFEEVAGKIASIKDPFAQAALAFKVFGLRGKAASDAMKVLKEDPAKLNNLLRNMRKQAAGTAQEMKELQLDNISGDFTKLSSAVDNAKIEFGSALASTLGLGGGVRGLTGAVSGLGNAFGFFAKNPDLLDAKVTMEGVSPKTVEMVQTILQTFRSLAKIIKVIADNMGLVVGATKVLVGLKVGGALAALFGLSGAKIAGGLLGGVGKLFKGGAAIAGAGKAAGGIAGIAKFLGPLAGALTAGAAAGTAIDKLTGLSDIISNALVKGKREAAAARVKEFERRISTPKAKVAKDATATRPGLLPVSAGDIVVDRSALASAITSQRRGAMLGRMGLGQGMPGVTTPPPATGGTVNVNVPVQIDGRQVALAVARVKLDDLQRSGATIRPGERRALLQRGFAPAF